MAVKTVQAIVNGQTYNLSYNSTTKKYEATITAPSNTSYHETNNKYGVTIKATDQAGNTTIKDRSDSTLGSSLQLRVLEKEKPVITLTSPSSGARVISATPSIKFQLRDESGGSGINISKLALKIDAGTVIGNTATGMTCTSVANGYDCVYVPQTALAEGTHTITISAEDNDGNVSDLLSSGFTVDTMPPALNINNPSEGLITNKSSLTVNGTTNDETSSPVIIKIKLNGADQGDVTVSSGSFSKAITLTEGSNAIEVTATDTAGLKTTITRNVTLDTKAPTISAVTITPNPVDCGKTYTITVTVSD